MHSCTFCDYSSNRKFCIKRHEISKHSKEILQENIPVVEENISLDIEENDCLNNNKKYFCSKCNKGYLHTKYLNKHEEKCIGVDIMTCPKCMISFTTSSAKSKHIKRNNCKAKSIIHARVPNIQNNDNRIINNNITNDNKIINDNRVINNDNRIINNYIINNYGEERLDYLTNDVMYDIIQKCDNSISLYIENKHFNKDFPENHNIKYDAKTKKCKVKENNRWKNMDISLVSSKLLSDNSDKLLAYCKDNKQELEERIKNDEALQFIMDRLLIIKFKKNKDCYNKVVATIKNLLEDSNKLIECA